MYKLLPYQASNYSRIEKSRHHLIGDEMGLGKTLVALHTHKVNNAKTSLTVCPASLIQNWKNEAQKFLGVELNEITGKNGFRKERFNVCSYERFRKINLKTKLDCLFLDEFHYIKNNDSKRTQALTDYFTMYEPEFFVGLSGTPIKNHAGEFFAPLNLIGRGSNYDFYFQENSFMFHKAFCYASVQKFNARGSGKSRSFTKFSGLKNAKALKNLIAPVFSRTTLEKAKIHLPKTTKQDHIISDRCEYDDRFNKMMMKFKEDNPSYETEGGVWIERNPEYMTLKRFNAACKVDGTIELAKGLKRQCVIFSDHVESCEMIAKGLNGFAMTGKVSDRSRRDIVDKFKKGDFQFLVGNYKVLGEGHNLTNANNMIFNDLPFTPSDLLQAEKRIDRIGQKLPCFYWYVYQSPMDKKLSDLLSPKIAALKAID